jgi:uncharacterized protein YgiB involved in biofilm formation
MSKNNNYGALTEKPMPRWKEVTWQVLVVGTIAGIIFWPSAKTVNTRRPIYNSLEECLADWNNTPTDCEARDETSGDTSNSIRIRRWYGPDVDINGRAYHADGRTSDGHTRFATSSFRGSSISRGGFGRGFSRGG